MSTHSPQGKLALQGKLVTVFGGSGFIGRYVVQELARQGARIRVAVRRPNEGHFLKPLGNVGQVAVVQANLRNEASVRRACEGADVVINLVGILFESGRQSFSALQEKGAERVARAASDAGARKLVQMSAIGANDKSEAAYSRTKAAGEQVAFAHGPNTTVVRPSIVFGPEDGFFNKFGGMAALSPALPLVGGGHTRFQPVYVADVADAIVRIAADPATDGQTYELGGPRVYTFRELMRLMLEVIERRRLLLPLPFWAAKILGKLMRWACAILPFAPPLTDDQVVMLQTDNVVADEAKGLADLGITPTGLEAIIPTYLYRFRKTGQYRAEDVMVGKG